MSEIKHSWQNKEKKFSNSSLLNVMNEKKEKDTSNMSKEPNIISESLNQNTKNRIMKLIDHEKSISAWTIHVFIGITEEEAEVYINEIIKSNPRKYHNRNASTSLIRRIFIETNS